MDGHCLICKYTHTYTHIHIYVYMYICIYREIHTHVHIDIYMYVFICIIIAALILKGDQAWENVHRGTESLAFGASIERYDLQRVKKKEYIIMIIYSE